MQVKVGRATLLALIASLLSVALVQPALAQTGAESVTADQYANLPSWTAPEMAPGESYMVDLSEDMPPPGKQGGRMNSCVGFATAYAMKSYMEVQDQGWQANHVRRVFSPSFVYNQVNRGQNRGTSVPAALNLLRTKGCATLATMPYKVGDYKTQPTRSAFTEASRFRISSWFRLQRSSDIRRALQEGHVVVIVVCTDPTFNSGRYKVYTAAMRAQAIKDAPPKQHGVHAMCVVGYNDRVGAYKIMNSWGKDWGQEGYCWVDYKLFKQIVPQNRNHFLWEAYIAIDERSRVRNSPGPVIPPPDNSTPINRNVAVNGKTQYVGYQNDQPMYRWSTWLRGAGNAMSNIKHVRWEYPGLKGGTLRYLRNNQAENFTFNATVQGTGNFPVSAVVTFKDNSTRTVKYNFALKGPKRRNLKLTMYDRFWGKARLNDGKVYNNWTWTVFVAGDMVDLYDIAKVTYHLDRGFQNPVRTVNGTAQNGFAITETGFRPFVMNADVRFRDGSTQRLQLRMQFRDPVRDQLSVKNSACYTNRTIVINGRLYYYQDWTAWVDGPLNLLQRITRVDYYLHPTFNPRVRSSSGTMYWGFPLSTSGYGEFDMQVVVWFNNGQRQVLQHRLKLLAQPLTPANNRGNTGKW
jgi:transcription initiation factor IIF auxiliary subunit